MKQIGIFLALGVMLLAIGRCGTGKSPSESEEPLGPSDDGVWPQSWDGSADWGDSLWIIESI